MINRFSVTYIQKVVYISHCGINIVQVCLSLSVWDEWHYLQLKGAKWEHLWSRYSPLLQFMASFMALNKVILIMQLKFKSVICCYDIRVRQYYFRFSNISSHNWQMSGFTVSWLLHFHLMKETSSHIHVKSLSYIVSCIAHLDTRLLCRSATENQSVEQNF